MKDLSTELQVSFLGSNVVSGVECWGRDPGPSVTSHGLALVEQDVKPHFRFKWKNAKCSFSNKEPRYTFIYTFKHWTFLLQSLKAVGGSWQLDPVAVGTLVLEVHRLVATPDINKWVVTSLPLARSYCFHRNGCWDQWKRGKWKFSLILVSIKLTSVSLATAVDSSQALATDSVVLSHLSAVAIICPWPSSSL